MPEKKVYARDALFICGEDPWANSINAPVIRVGSSPYTLSGQSDQSCLHVPGGNIGLLQFQEIVLPAHYGITHVFLNLYVRHVSSGECRIGIYRNKEPFEGITVVFKTRPAIYPERLAVLPVRKEAQGGYVSCDISSLPGECCEGRIPGFGLSLLADKTENTEAVFSSNHYGLPPFLSIGYCTKKESRPASPPWKQIVKNIFCEEVFACCGKNGPLFTPVIEVTRARNITFFIKNNGSDSLEARLQISPNGIDFMDDPQVCKIDENEIKALTPYLFARFVRVRVDSSPACKPVQAQIWCQLQTLDYVVK